MYTQIDNIIDAAIHYRNRQIIFRIVSSEKNRGKYLAAAREMNARKKALATAMARTFNK
ncbi:hypothetical protein [Companilactobacillus mishanensis]|uniref:hypothetical protein n=1 Tax=Companilactobacillus mishanensis TaxID=2486008 RepID=UPI00129739C3|nr:hypothetical protein [Companilactobacillus mishanensis]